jgi:dCTP deaminase
MTILSDRWIRRMAQEKGMIEPFVDAQKREGVISYGLSSYGYDARVGNDFKIFTNVNSAVVDPKNFDQNSFVDRNTDICVIPPNSFALARTVEYFRIPRDVLVICVGKSTYARCGIIVNVTPLEPEWEGHVTLEFSSSRATNPARSRTVTRLENTKASAASPCPRSKEFPTHGSHPNQRRPPAQG